jgi:hypothetical protein
MTKRVLGVLAALAMMGGSAIACSGSSTPGPATGTDGGVDANKGDTKDSGKPSPVDGGDSAIPPVCDKSTGKACATDDECDTTGEGKGACTKGLFGGDSLYPTNNCIQRECDLPDPTKVTYCDCDTGVCLSTGSGGICLPACQWKDDGAAPEGCEGKNACNPYAWGTDSTTMAVVGIGYCFGGCKADTDCSDGQKCQTENGLCVKAKETFVKTLGTACTDADAKDPAKCNCLYATDAAGTKSGYCSAFCTIGGPACAAGYTCDAGLPKTKIADDDIVFTKAPTGFAGNCLKDCTSDADCAGLNGYCDETAGTGKKTCQIGLRPCMTTAQCVDGKTCQGATATAYGRCK